MTNSIVGMSGALRDDVIGQRQAIRRAVLLTYDYQAEVESESKSD